MVVGVFESTAGQPLGGRIEFIPRELWVEHDGQHYATLSSDLELVNGAFSVMLTPNVWYRVRTPYGSWPVKITGGKPVQRLRELLDHAYELKNPE